MRLGILGTGMIVKDLLTTYDLLGIEYTAVLATKATEDEASALVDKYHLDKYFLDFDELLKDDIDTVYVALPNHLHYSFAKKALEHGKHVIVEKPITANVQELKELVEIAKEKQLFIFEAMNIHYLPAYQALKQCLTKIGQPKIVSLNYSQYSSRYNAFKAGNILPAFDFHKAGGALMDLNVYNIHFVVGLFGKPEHVHYYANIEHDIDTSGVLCLNYPNFEAVCIAAKDCSAPISTTIQGDKGCIKIDGPVSVLSDVQILKNTENSERIDTGNYHRLYSEFKAFTTYIDNLDFKACNKMLEHSYIVMDVLTQARKSANIVFGVEKNT